MRIYAENQILIEKFGNIWEHARNYDAVVITTNGFVKKNGEAVMGRGIALEAKTFYPWLPKSLGDWIKTAGNTVGIFRLTLLTGPEYLITMPVKPIYGPNGEPGWRAKANLDIIRDSAYYLVAHANNYKLQRILMPRPGAGNGGLNWEKVKEVIEPILDDRFTVMTFQPEI